MSLRGGLLAANGELAKRWPVWLAFALMFYLAILVLVYAHHNWVADFDSPPLLWRVSYGLGLCDLQCRMAFMVSAFFPAFCRIRLAPARCAAALGLRHLSRALYLHHLAGNTPSMIIRFQRPSNLPSCSPPLLFDELGPHRDFAKNSRRGGG